LKHPLIMPPRLYLLSILRTIAFRPKAPVSTWRNERTTRILPLCRNFADSKDPPAAGRSKNIDTQPLPHVSEEAVKKADIAGSRGPEIEQRTLVEEVRRIDDAHR
jgi:small subunit ribosomal protein S7